ncbi:15125_t:CDS:2 [Rhizophagus irregularis]|nr:15125_t:CDS:2 [Rhizophagus irregularis]
MHIQGIQDDNDNNVGTKVTAEVNINDAGNTKLKIYLDCHTQESALLIQFYGISKHPVSNDYFIVKQFHKNASSLTDYISHNFNNLNWEMKLHLLLYLSEDLKALHNAGYVHRYYKHPSSILVVNESYCAIETFLEYLRPNIHEVHNTLLNLWTSIYHNKYSTSLNLMCLDFSAADNNKDYSDSNTQEIITKRAVSSDLETSEMIKYIEENSLVKVFSIDKLTMMTPINNDHFCKISKATLKTEKTDIIVACKRFKSTLLDKTFLHELKMQHKKLYFCLRILRVLGISLETKENLLITEYADGGNLRMYLKDHPELTWDDRIKLAYQITEGIKFLQGEKILHLFSKLVKLGREMSIQDFQDIKCDDDDMQTANINGEADDNYDLDVPNGTI